MVEREATAEVRQSLLLVEGEGRWVSSLEGAESG